MSAKLSSTSAAVLLLASPDTYHSHLARQLYGEQDLSAGQKLYERMLAVSPLFGELVKNRKFAVSRMVQQALSAQPQIKQVVVAAAGQDPLGLDVAVQHPDLNVFEVDAACLKSKQQWAREHNVHNLFCTQGDLRQPQQVRQSLVQMGWRPGEGSCWVFEGIVYYITAEHLKNLVAEFTPVASVLDYIHHSKLEPLHAEAQKMMHHTWHSIEEETGQPIDPTYYDAAQLEKIFNKMPQKLQGVHELQKQRTGDGESFAFLGGQPWLQVAWF